MNSSSLVKQRFFRVTKLATVTPTLIYVVAVGDGLKPLADEGPRRKGPEDNTSMMFHRKIVLVSVDTLLRM